MEAIIVQDVNGNVREYVTPAAVAPTGIDERGTHCLHH
jgi:hypothetical protein